MVTLYWQVSESLEYPGQKIPEKIVLKHRYIS